MSNQPAKKLKIGLVTATIWDNDNFFSVEFSRSYKDSDGNWKSSDGFGHGDLPAVEKLASLAEAWIREHPSTK